MATKIGNRVLETSTTTGTGTYTLLGSAPGKQAFLSDVNISSGDSVLYCAFDASQWEIGVGTITSGASDTLSRDTIIRSSDGATAINWGTGTRTIISDVPAEALLTFADRTTTAGLLARTGTWAYAWRSINVQNGLTITNANGGSGNPIIGHNNTPANGFTGQTGCVKGDAILGIGVNTLGKLAVGADGTVRVADAAQATGQKWLDISPGLRISGNQRAVLDMPAIPTVATPYTVTASDRGKLIVANATTAQSINLPNTSTFGDGGMVGVMRFNTALVTIVPDTSQAINGNTANRTLDNRYDGLVLSTDGSSWFIVARMADSAPLTTATAVGFAAGLDLVGIF